jgi:hypothetical protein
VRVIKRQRESATFLSIGSDGFCHPHRQTRRRIRGERCGAVVRLHADRMSSFRLHSPVKALALSYDPG